MAVHSLLLLFFGVVLLSLANGADGATCHFQKTYYTNYRSYTFYKYCYYGCCSTGCCSSNSYSSYRSTSYVGASVAIIVGCVIGAIALIAFIIVAICCCVRRRGRPGQVIVTGQPGFTTAAPGVAVIQTSNTHTSAPTPSQPQYNYGMQPMGGPPGNAGFKPYAEPPPAYPGYSNAAYSTSDNPGTTPTYPPSSGGESNLGDNSGGTPGLANAGSSQPPAPGFNLQ